MNFIIINLILIYVVDSQNFVNLYKMNLRYGVLGGGSWGTAIVKILSENNDVINWYVRSDENVSSIKENGKNPKYLRSINLKMSKINPSSSIIEVVNKSEVLILAIPSPFVDDELKKIKHLISEKKIFSALKPKAGITTELFVRRDSNVSLIACGCSKISFCIKCS